MHWGWWGVTTNGGEIAARLGFGVTGDKDNARQKAVKRGAERGRGRERTEAPARLGDIKKAEGKSKMRGIAIFVFILTLTGLVAVFGFTEVFGPVARAAIVWVPAIFTVSLLIGFASRRQTWFR